MLCKNWGFPLSVFSKCGSDNRFYWGHFKLETEETTGGMCGILTREKFGVCRWQWSADPGQRWYQKHHHSRLWSEVRALGNLKFPSKIKLCCKKCDLNTYISNSQYCCTWENLCCKHLGAGVKNTGHVCGGGGLCQPPGGPGRTSPSRKNACGSLFSRILAIELPKVQRGIPRW